MAQRLCWPPHQANVYANLSESDQLAKTEDTVVMPSTPLAETEDVFDLTEAVPETERLDNSLQKAKAQLSIKTRRHRPSRSHLRDSFSSTEGDDSLDGKQSCSGLLSGTCSPCHVSLHCPAPFSDLHPFSSPAKKDRAFTFEITESEKKEQRGRSACLLNSSSPIHLLKRDHFQQRQEDHTPVHHRDHFQLFQEDSLQLWQGDNLKLHKENSHIQHRDSFHLHQEVHTDLHQGDHLLLHLSDHQKLCQRDHTHLRQGDNIRLDQEAHICLHQRDHLQNDQTHLKKGDHLQKDHTQVQMENHLQKDHTRLRNRAHLKTDQTTKDHEQNHSPLHKRDYSQSEDDAHDIGLDESSSPTVLLDKKTRRRFLDLGVTLRRTYVKVRREGAIRHTSENQLAERIRGSDSQKNSSQSPAKSLSEVEAQKVFDMGICSACFTDERD